MVNFAWLIKILYIRKQKSEIGSSIWSSFHVFFIMSFESSTAANLSNAFFQFPQSELQAFQSSKAFAVYTAPLTTSTKGTICKKKLLGWIFNWAFCHRDPMFFFSGFRLNWNSCVYIHKDIFIHPCSLDEGEVVGRGKGKSRQSLTFLGAFNSRTTNVMA